MGKKTSIYLSADLAEKLRVLPRGPSAAVSATIDRYYALVAPEQRRLHLHFTPEEWAAMRDACSGTAWTGASIRGGVLASIQDSLDTELKAWGADRAALEGKLAMLSPAQQYALVESIEAFWEAASLPDVDD